MTAVHQSQTNPYFTDPRWNVAEATSAEAAMPVDHVNHSVRVATQESFAQLSFVFLVFEMLKLAIIHDEQEKFFRAEERKMLITHMEKVASNFKSQGTFMLATNVLGGVLSLVSAGLPMFAHNTNWGTKIFDKFKGWLGLGDMKQKKFFETASKMLFSMSEISKASSQVNSNFADAEKTRDQYKGEIRKTDENENTRRIDEINRRREEVFRLALSLIQMMAENARALNGG